MRRQHHTWRQRSRQLVTLLISCAPSCAPSDFDALDQPTHEPASCADASCTEDAAEEREAGPVEPSDAALEPDVITVDGLDAAPDASAEDLDGGSPALECDGTGPVCLASELAEQHQPCGSCASGIRTRRRSCEASGCSWGKWGEWGQCEQQSAQCDPSGPPQQQTVACPTCGTRTESRSCAPTTCSWGAWTASTACSWCDECAEVVYCDTPANIANRGTWCRQKACSREQALSDCQEDAQTFCGGTVQPFFMEYL